VKKCACRAFRLFIFIVALLSCLPVFGEPAPSASGKVSKVLRIGVGRNNPPYSFVDKGKIVGFWVDLARETALVLGYDPEIRIDVWDTVKGDIEAGRLDVAAAMADTPERRPAFAFSLPISMITYALWTRKDSSIASTADLSGKAVVVQRGSTMADRLGKASPPMDLSLVQDDVDALVLLDSGRYDAAILPMAQGLFYAQELGLEHVRALPEALLSVDQCFAVAKGNERLVRELDSGLEILKQSGSFKAIRAKWLGIYAKKATRRTVWRLVLGLSIVASLFLIALALALALRRTVKLRTAELSANERKYRVLVESLPQMIFVKDRDSTFLSCNGRFAESLGIGPDEIAGKSDFDFYPPELAAIYREGDRSAIESGASAEFVEHWPGASGETWIYTVKTPIRDSSGEVVGVIGIFWDISDRKRLEEEKERRLEEKEMLLHEVNHRVKNNLQLINAIIRLELGQRSSPELVKFVVDTTSRISSISTIHEMLYASDDMTEIPVGDYLRKIAFNLIETYSPPQRSIEMSVDAGDLRLDLNRMVSFGLISNEMITNSLKYAFEGRPKGRIAISMARDEETGELLFDYADDGVGLPLDFDMGNVHSLGMVFIRSLVDQLDGEVTIRSEGGLEYGLRFGVDGSRRRCLTERTGAKA
jgi:PAS domain S-box-containing protein